MACHWEPPSSGPTVTAVKVVDASALAALLFGEKEAEAVAASLEGARLTALALLGFELANVRLTKMRRHPAQREALRAAFRLADRLAVETVAVDHGAIYNVCSASPGAGRHPARTRLRRTEDSVLRPSEPRRSPPKMALEELLQRAIRPKSQRGVSIRLATFGDIAARRRRITANLRAAATRAR